MTTNQQNPMNCQYIEALVLETLRHFTVLPLSLPRLTTKRSDTKISLFLKRHIYL